jgi:SAM-dependent methyltransferase
MSYSTLESCIVCKENIFIEIFKINNIFLTGIFPLKNENDPISTPITLKKCTNCSNIQMHEKVDPLIMFNEYWYRSGTTKSMINHLHKTFENTGIIEGKILDIGCNDGTLLAIASSRGMIPFGIDPSQAVLEAEIKFKNNIYKDFFTEKFVLDKLVEHINSFSLVTAISMFYDVPKPNDFLNGISLLLKPDGIAVIEVNYAKTFFERGNVDMLGQEHLIYYFIKTFEILVQESDLFLYDAYESDMNGGNITFFLTKTSKHKTNRLKELIKNEEIWIDQFDFNGFQLKINKSFNLFKKWLIELSTSQTIKILGASTRGAFIVQLLSLDRKIITSAVDLQINKKGRRMAGTSIEIEYDPEHTPPDYYLVMPYQFKEEILKRYQTYMQRGGKLIFYRPDFLIYYWDNVKNIIGELSIPGCSDFNGFP